MEEAYRCGPWQRSKGLGLVARWLPLGWERATGNATEKPPCRLRRAFLCRLGLTKSIGVSNFNISQMEEIRAVCQAKSSAAQIPRWISKDPTIGPTIDPSR